MKTPNYLLLNLCLLFVALNVWDAALTIHVIQNGLGGEYLGIMSNLIEKLSIYNAMALKIILVTVLMHVVYTMDGKYDTITFRGCSIKGITIIYLGLVLVNLAYILIVLNGFIVIFFPTYAPLQR